MKHFSYICLFLLVFSSCSLRAVREAQDVVAEADSLWAAGQMYGRDSGDSATLAQAYEQLGNLSPLRFPLSVFRFPLSASYAHSCYHYGRLLRNNDDPVAAMQTFINATHSHTRDYHILGRVYSNMGDLCHLAGEFSLAYDMYDQTAKMYLNNSDTLLYYYGLYRKAFEKACLSDIGTCKIIIDEISQSTYADSSLIAHCYLAYSEAHLLCHHYDSTIYYAHKSLCHLESLYIAKLQLAQAYSFIGIKDSAVYYAQSVLESTTDLWAVNNALYILTHDDDTKDRDGVLQTSAERSDTQKLLETRQGKLSQAVQLLEQDLNRKHDLRWLYAIIFTIVIISIGIVIYIRVKRKKQTLLTQQIDVLEQTASEMKEQRKQKILANCELFEESDEIKNLLRKEDYHKVCELINSHFLMFADKLKMIGNLNEKDVCLCIFVMIGSFTDKQIADILYYSHKTIRSTKRNVAKKLGTTSAQFRLFLLEKAVE